MMAKRDESVERTPERVVAVVQARMASSRLPGKVLRKVMDKPLLGYLIERLRRVPRIDEVVVATTTNSLDDAIVVYCSALNVSVFRGSEHDVLQRYYLAAQKYRADVVMRITADCPLLDPDVAQRVLEKYLQSDGEYDYVSNVQERHYPRGLDVEVLSFPCLERMHGEALEPHYREHVTSFVRSHPDRFRVASVSYDEDHSAHRWTVDTEEDFSMVAGVLEGLYRENPAFGMHNVLEFLDRNPNLRNKNSHIEQRGVL